MRSLAATLSLAVCIATIWRSSAQLPAKPMSFSNRLLLNPAAGNGEATGEVMLALEPHALAETFRPIARIGGRIPYTHAAGGDAPVSLGTHKLIDAVDH